MEHLTSDIFNLDKIEEMAVASPHTCCLYLLVIRLAISDRKLKLTVPQTQNVGNSWESRKPGPGVAVPLSP